MLRAGRSGAHRHFLIVSPLLKTFVVLIDGSDSNTDIKNQLDI